MNKPLFSIIVPTYNRASQIGKTIESVIGQSASDWELIIIDDGSTDGTQDVVAAYSSNDSRIHYHYQENQERSAARNNGIEKANGEYILFLDSDDEFDKDNLRNWEEFWRSNNNDASFAYGDMLIHDGPQHSNVKGEEIKGNLQDYLFTHPIVPGRICIPKKVLSSYRFETYMSVGEDVALWLLLSKHAGLLYSEHNCLIYHVHATNTTAKGSNAPIKMLRGFRRFFTENRQLRDQISSEVYRSYMSEIITNISKYNLYSGKRFPAILNAFRAIITKPRHKHTKYRLNLIRKALFSPKSRLNEQV